MDFARLPIGFAMALAQNETAMKKYSAMSDAQKQSVISRAHNAESEKEMHSIVSSLASEGE